MRLKQTIRETLGAVHEFANLVLRLGRNFHHGFDDVYEPIRRPIERHEDEKKRLASFEQSAKERGKDLRELHRKTRAARPVSAAFLLFASNRRPGGTCHKMGYDFSRPRCRIIGL